MSGCGVSSTQASRRSAVQPPKVCEEVDIDVVGGIYSVSTESVEVTTRPFYSESGDVSTDRPLCRDLGSVRLILVWDDSQLRRAPGIQPNRSSRRICQ